ncbi:hypothetical protein ElyMa_003805900 [Elysia marginata]|uniref:Uncharacterized protein n=1 Tax=Elysia marginata TaxID=1093978 RepID=A0AAV4FDU6_9GAST|nr:hypothetical protein ElyMa_003805900 [Elysia marginata]
MSFPHHKPACWELFRNEPLECQDRRAAIAKSQISACKDRKKNPLWWDAQKYIDQVVPAEFVHPSDIDTATYRYQVFARPPPIPCPPRSLREVTDAPPPIRYNVKRVAVDKQFPPPRFDCAGQWSKHQFAFHKNRERGSCAGQDSSENNNTGPSKLGRLVASKDTKITYRDKNSTFRKDMSFDRSFAKSNSHESISTSARPHTDCQNEIAPCVNENNSRTISSQALANTQQQQAKDLGQVTPSKTSHLWDIPERKHAAVNSRLVQGMLQEPQMSIGRPIQGLPGQCDQSIGNTERSYINATLNQDGNSNSEQTSSTSPRKSSRRSNSNLSSHSTRCERPGNQLENSSFKNSRDLNPTISHISLQMDPTGLNFLLKPPVLRNCSSVSSRASSPCSVSTVSSYPSTKNAPSNNKGKLNQGEPIKIVSYLERDSVASLLSERKASPVLVPIVSRGRKQFSISNTVKSQESVASLLTNSNQNNNNMREVSVVLLPTGALQDIFAELTSPFLPQDRLYFNTPDFERDAKAQQELCNLNKRWWSSSHATIGYEYLMTRSSHEVRNNSNTNNNSSAVPQDEHERYILKCCPLKTNTRQYNAFLEPENENMLCRFHGKRPEMLDNQSFLLDQVVPIDPKTWKLKDIGYSKELKCTMLTDCQTGKPIEGTEGPLMVCEPRKPKTPIIGYGTYKIVGGKQRREKPLSNYATNLRFPPDIEEYREFVKRCPNFKYGRYDRTNPLNEMLIPSNKSTTLLGGSAKGPYTFCKMPRRNLPPLFKQPKINSAALVAHGKKGSE